jgi:hypothetical protein
MNHNYTQGFVSPEAFVFILVNVRLSTNSNQVRPGLLEAHSSLRIPPFQIDPLIIYFTERLLMTEGDSSLIHDSTGNQDT